MACDERLVERIRIALDGVAGVTEKRMFGGACFLVNGNMAAGVAGELLMLRLGEAAAAALEKPGIREMDFTGKPLKGFVYAEPAAVNTEPRLRRWLELSVAFANTLPPKKKKPAQRKGAKSSVVK
jgi:TfoX/Sxy family transcriptional regulator of competence genes